MSWKHVHFFPLLLRLIIKFKDIPTCLEKRYSSFISSVIYLKNDPVHENNMHRLGETVITKTFKLLRHCDLCIMLPLSFFSF